MFMSSSTEDVTPRTRRHNGMDERNMFQYFSRFVGPYMQRVIRGIVKSAYIIYHPYIFHTYLSICTLLTYISVTKTIKLNHRQIISSTSFFF
jgi:hypothetical protein